MITATEALQRLREGNHRFVSGIHEGPVNPSHPDMAGLHTGQAPFAVILGCSDSRVPTEQVFDRRPGDLFVVRVAGNIAGSTQIGSIEFAAVNFSTRLVVVLGHANCGAVVATLKDLEKPADFVSPDLQSIVEMIRPAVEPLVAAGSPGDWDDLVRRSVRANVERWVRRLGDGPVLGRLMNEDGLRIVGAEYDLQSGVVHFHDDDPSS